MCERACERPRSCSHPCPSNCHPGPCEPCKVECSMECHCGKTDLTFPCGEQQQINQSSSSKAGKGAAAAGGRDPLCCGKVCGRELPLCPHTCAAQCHVGVCPASSNCSEEVTVRCSCRRLKEKWECARVLAALTAAAGSSGSSKLYDGSTALKLLPCDELCAAAAKDKQQQQQQHGGVSSSSRDVSPARSSSTGKQVLPAPAAAAAAAAAGTAAAATAAAAGGGKSWKKLSRAEREALAAAKEAERLKQQRQQQMRTIATYAAIMMVVAAVGVGLALGIERLMDVLKVVDKKLQEKYSLDATPEL